MWMDATELLSQQRAAVLAIRLYQGKALSTAEAGQMIGITERGALYLLDLLSEVLPLYRDEGRWRWLGDQDG